MKRIIVKIAVTCVAMSATVLRVVVFAGYRVYRLFGRGKV